MQFIFALVICLNFLFWSIDTVNSRCAGLPKRKGIIVNCKSILTGEVIDCHSDSLPPYTIVNYGCIKSFYVPSDPSQLPDSFMCMNITGKVAWTPHYHFDQLTCILILKKCAHLDCGVSLNDVSPNVIEGEIVDRANYPWHVSIFGRKNSSFDFSYICGGTLVNPFNKGLVVLTAAHCLATPTGEPRNINNYRIVLGANSSIFTQNKNIQNAQTLKIREIIIHEGYENVRFQADIAIIALEGEVRLSQNVLPACFSESFDGAKPGEIGEVVGFGQFGFENDERVSPQLRKVDLPIVEGHKCYEWRAQKIFNEICAGFEDGPSVCKGDSGGGLLVPVTFRNENRYFVQGIVSHGRKTEAEDEREENSCDSYSVFTKVRPYSHWIRNTLERLSLQKLEEESSAEIIETQNQNTQPNPYPKDMFVTINFAKALKKGTKWISRNILEPITGEKIDDTALEKVIKTRIDELRTSKQTPAKAAIKKAFTPFREFFNFFKDNFNT